MKVVRDPSLTIYFGDASDRFLPDEYKKNPADHQFERVIQVTGTRPLFLHQVHGATGEVITQQRASRWRPFEHEGDFLITNLPDAGLGVVTADCLPVIVYDPVHMAIGIAHAGWRGTMAGIVPAMLDNMSQEFNSQLTQIQVWFGSGMKSCCYEVQQNLIDKLPSEWRKIVIRKEGKRCLFDLPQLIMLQLEEAGVPAQVIDLSYHECTHCNVKFYSHRRDQQLGRNMTVVCLH